MKWCKVGIFFYIDHIHISHSFCPQTKKTVLHQFIFTSLSRLYSIFLSTHTFFLLFYLICEAPCMKVSSCGTTIVQRWILWAFLLPQFPLQRDSCDISCYNLFPFYLFFQCHLSPLSPVSPLYVTFKESVRHWWEWVKKLTSKEANLLQTWKSSTFIFFWVMLLLHCTTDLKAVKTVLWNQQKTFHSGRNLKKETKLNHNIQYIAVLRIEI